MERVNYKSIWKYFKIQGNVDMCKKCKKILLEEDPSTSNHLNLHHRIDLFDDGKFPACTIPLLHDHFQFGMTTTCDYCCKTEDYLKVLDELKAHLIEIFHEKYHVLTTEEMYRILYHFTWFNAKCNLCRAISTQLYHMHTSLVRHLKVKHPKMLSYRAKIRLNQITTFRNLLIEEMTFQNEIQPNSQTDCEIKQKMEEHSESLPIHHDKMSLKRIATSSTHPNLLRKQKKFQNKIQPN